jgi:GNAT superfamily N-acetyltransferase
VKLADENPVEIWGELRPLLDDCYREIGMQLLRPDLEEITVRRERGERTLTFRLERKLIGFCRMTVRRGLAFDSGMFIAAPYRGGLAALKMVEFAEDRARQLGAKLMVWECDERSGARVLAERRGYALITRKYLVNLEGRS